MLDYLLIFNQTALIFNAVLQKKTTAVYKLYSSWIHAVPKCCEDKMALKMVFLSLQRCLCIQYAFLKLLLSRVIWLSLEEIDISVPYLL